MFHHWRFPRFLTGHIARLVLILLFTTLNLSVYLNTASIAQARASHSLSINGLAQTPYMGWSSWSLESTNYPGYNKSWLTEANVKTQADVVHQKLQSHGYQYINIDAGWWMDYSWNPSFDTYGRPIPYSGRFPDGIANVASYVHQEGLKLGIYFVVGLDTTVYNNNDPIYGTSCHAQDIAIQPLQKTNGWSGAYAIDFSKSCAQTYINSIANEFAHTTEHFIKQKILLFS